MKSLKWRQLWVLFLVLMSPLVTTSCFKSKKSKVASLGNGITLTGRVVDPSGVPLPSADIFVGEAQNPSGRTDGGGFFRIDLSADEMLLVKGGAPYAQDAFHLFFNSSAGLSGISPLVSFEERGARDLGVIEALPGRDVFGMVMLMPQGRGLLRGTGAAVTIGHQKVLVEADGSFMVPQVPVGRVPVTVSAKGYIPYFHVIDTAAELPIDGPIVLFTEFGVAGTLIPVPLSENLIKNRDEAFTREFISRASRHARWIRFHHDLTVLTEPTDTEEAPRVDPETGEVLEPLPEVARPSDQGDFWYIAEGRFQYNFPSGGGQFLYYQYANEEKNEFSPIYQISVDVNVFHDTEGVVIGDGSGVSQSAKVMLNIDLPAAATRMRVSESETDIISRPWQAPMSQYEYIFTPTTERQLLGRAVYVQFADAFGNESAVYSDRVELDLFTTPGPTIESGAGIINRPVAAILTNRPVSAISMRYGDDSASLEDQPWVEAQDLVFHMFSSNTDPSTGFETVSGDRKFRIQYQDAYGFVSSIIEAPVFIDMFPTGDEVFVINGNQPVSQSKTFFLDINIPLNAYEMRVFALNRGADVIFDVSGAVTSTTEDDTTRNLWLRARPFYAYTVQNKGAKDVYVQFRDPNGFVSPLYKKSIDIQPFSNSAGEGGFSINNGATITSNPLLALDIRATQDAVFMAITEDAPADASFAGWQDLANQVEYPVRGRGMKQIFLRFMSADQTELSQVYRQQIFYEPFPWQENTVVINGGAGATTSRLIDIAFTNPENAVAMRFHHDLETVTTLPWQNLTSAARYELPEDFGPQRIFVQYRNQVEDESLLFSDEVILERLRDIVADDVIQINNNEATTDSEFVAVSLNLPDVAEEFRISDSQIGLEEQPWLTPTSTIPYQLPDENGVYTIYMQYRNDSDQISSVFFDSIVLEKPLVPRFDVSSDLIVINSGAELATDRDVVLSLNLAPQAVEFRVAEEPAVLATLPWLAPATRMPFTLVAREGSHTIYLQMRNSEGEVSGLYFDSIELDLPFIADIEVPSDIIVINDGAAITEDYQVTARFNLPEEASAIRLSESDVEITTLSWVDAVSSMNFNLEVFDGVHTVYLQFLTSDGRVSILYPASIVLDMPDISDFELSDDIIRINGDDLVTTTADVELSFDLPPQAAQIRFSQDLTALETLPWVHPTSPIAFRLSSISSGGAGAEEGDEPGTPATGTATEGAYNVFMQYQTEDELVSPVFLDSIILDTRGLAAVEGIIVINSGEATVTSPDVALNLELPAEAVSVRFSEDPERIEENEWINAVSTIPFSLVETPGTHTIFMQYQTRDGIVSPLFFDSVILELTDQGLVSADIIRINGDAPSTDSRDVTLNFDLPVEAAQVRFSEGIAGIAEAQFVSAAALSTAPLRLTGPNGLITVYMQYQTHDDRLSPLFFDSIELNEVVEDVVLPSDAIVINGNDATTDERDVVLSFNLPEEAVAVQFSESSSFEGAQWFSRPETAPFTLSDREGIHTVYMIYRRADLTVSTVSFDTIILDNPTDDSVVIPEDIVRINNDDAVTDSVDVFVSLNLPTEARQVRFSESADFAGATWFSAATTEIPFRLIEEEGLHTVYMTYQDEEGQISPVFFDTIILDVPTDSGVVIPDDIITINSGDAIADSRDVILSFNLPEEARQVRFSESLSFEGSAWFAITSTATAPFQLEARDGLHTVYMVYQTADEQISPVFFDSIVLDTPLDGGMTFPEDIIEINNGDAETNSRQVVLSFNLPEEAVEIRFSESTGFEDAVWFNANSTQNIPVSLNGFDGERNVYMEYRTASGQVSPIFFDSITLDTTVAIPEDIFEIAGGATTTDSINVNLNTNLPAEAVEVRFSEDPTFPEGLWYNAGSAAVTPFSLMAEDGIRTVYMMYRRADGSLSSLFVDSIILDRPEDVSMTFPADIMMVNAGDATTPSRDVVITLDLPAEAREVRFSESPRFEDGVWLNASTSGSAPFQLGSAEGVHTIYMEYRNAEGISSPVFFDSIVLDVPAESVVAISDDIIRINSNAAVATQAVVALNLDLPAEAVQVRFGESTDLSAAAWFNAAAEVPYTFSGPDGVRAVYMEYRTAAGDISPLFADSIVLDLPTDATLTMPAAVISIAGGAESVTETLVTLNLDLPAEAIEVRFSETAEGIELAPWISRASEVPFTLSETPGAHAVFVQYRTAQGLESPLFFDVVDLILP